MEYPKTVKQKLEELGIIYENFELFYNRVKEDNTIPPKDIMGENQYSLIEKYLTDNGVITPDGIDKDGLELISIMMDLEATLNSCGRDFDEDIDDDIYENSGGLMPCNEYDDDGPSGGLMPCR